MSVYLDASVLVSLFTTDANSGSAESILVWPGGFVVSDFTAAEFASAVSRRVRTGELTNDEARQVLSDFDDLTEHWRRVGTEPGDIRRADSYLRRLDNSLRTPDALNIAICHRLGCRLATFDRRMADEATKLGVPT